MLAVFVIDMSTFKHEIVNNTIFQPPFVRVCILIRIFSFHGVRAVIGFCILIREAIATFIWVEQPLVKVYSLTLICMCLFFLTTRQCSPGLKSGGWELTHGSFALLLVTYHI